LCPGAVFGRGSGLDQPWERPQMERVCQSGCDACLLTAPLTCGCAGVCLFPHTGAPDGAVLPSNPG
jgi:hypothetical protein